MSGLHVQFMMDANYLDEALPYSEGWRLPIVVDYMGNIDTALGVDQGAFDSCAACSRRAGCGSRSQAPTAARRRKIIVENPVRLYGEKNKRRRKTYRLAAPRRFAAPPSLLASSSAKAFTSA
ncbi:hypothetical protein D3C83_09060 [compost metagenome]